MPTLYTTLKLANEGALALITLNRPERRNAISMEMIGEMLAALDAVENGAARVAIITGEGNAFCSGMDLEALKSLAGQSAEKHLADSELAARFFRRLWEFPKPLIAAVNGPAIAGGCLMATLCDFTLAAPEAKFGYTETRVGFLPALVTVFLERQVGEKVARDLLLSGRIINAEEARELGLITRIVPAAQLLFAARELAAVLIANSPSSMLVTKRLLTAPLKAEMERRLEMAIQESADIRGTADFREGLASFLEKRKPRWTGK